MTEEANSAPRAADGAAIAIAALVVYLLLGQDTFYQVDAQGIVKLLATGESGHYLHFLYLPAVRALAFVLSPLELDAYTTARVASAAGTAFGALCAHGAAAELGLGRGRAALAALLVATAPAVVFFATVVEFHGVFFAFAGIVWLALARLVARPTLLRAAALGVATAVAGFVHGTGQLCAVLAAAWFVAATRERGLRLGRAAGFVTAAAVTHAALLLAVPRVLDVPAGNLVDYWGRYIENPPPVAHAGTILWHDWLRSLAPLSALWLPAFAVRALRLEALALLATLAVYLATCFFLIPDGHERGAYQLPLAVGAALLAVRALPASALFACCLISAGIAVHDVRAHDTASPERAKVVTLRAAIDERAVLLAGRIEEVNALSRWAPDVEYMPFYDAVALVLLGLPQMREEFAARIHEFIDARRAAGGTVYLLEGAHDLVAVSRAGGAARELWRRLSERYRFVEVETGSWRAWRIEGR